MVTARQEKINRTDEVNTACKVSDLLISAYVLWSIKEKPDFDFFLDLTVLD